LRSLQEQRDHGKYRGTQRGRLEEAHGAARVHQATVSLWRQEGSFSQGDIRSRFRVAGDQAEQRQG
jgi:hypothetical protein